MPAHDLAIELQDLRFQRPQLGTQSHDTTRATFGIRLSSELATLITEVC
jgi:hypothetical protein